MMKKLSLLLALVLLISVGCTQATDEIGDDSVDVDVVETDKTTGSEGSEDTSDTPEVVAPAGFAFEYNGVVVEMHEEAAPIIEALGEPATYFEAESCAFQGMDRIYTYNGFVVQTYELEGTELILLVYFLDDSVETMEGVYLYGTLEDIVAAYGEDYTKSLESYKYQKDTSELTFLLENDEIVSIEYYAITE